MPQQDEDSEALVRRAYDAFARGDSARLLELVHPGLEWTYLNPDDPEPRPQVCHGSDQLARAIARRPGPGDPGPGSPGPATEIEEITASGDKVLVIARTPGAGQRRAWTSDDRNVMVVTVAGGQITALHAFSDQAEARAFAGLA